MLDLLSAEPWVVDDAVVEELRQGVTDLIERAPDDWKQLGVRSGYVDKGGCLAAEVSDIDPSRSITLGGFSVPGLVSRQSETTVRLGDGQSFAVAGLLSNQIRSSIDKIPLFGDIPIIGALFRSVDYRRDESELLVVVTARLARPLAPMHAVENRLRNISLERRANTRRDRLDALRLRGVALGGDPAREQRCERLDHERAQRL